MKRDLKSSKNAPPSPNAPIGEADMQRMMDQPAADGIRDAMNYYGNKSSDELMDELVHLRRSGKMDDAQITDLVSRMMPMLGPEQQQRLYSILSKLT